MNLGNLLVLKSDRCFLVVINLGKKNHKVFKSANTFQIVFHFLNQWWVIIYQGTISKGKFRSGWFKE